MIGRKFNKQEYSDKPKSKPKINPVSRFVSKKQDAQREKSNKQEIDRIELTDTDTLYRGLHNSKDDVYYYVQSAKEGDTDKQTVYKLSDKQYRDIVMMPEFVRDNNGRKYPRIKGVDSDYFTDIVSDGNHVMVGDLDLQQRLADNMKKSSCLVARGSECMIVRDDKTKKYYGGTCIFDGETNKSNAFNWYELTNDDVKNIRANGLHDKLSASYALSLFNTPVHTVLDGDANPMRESIISRIAKTSPLAEHVDDNCRLRLYKLSDDEQYLMYQPDARYEKCRNFSNAVITPVSAHEAEMLTSCRNYDKMQQNISDIINNGYVKPLKGKFAEQALQDINEINSKNDATHKVMMDDISEKNKNGSVYTFPEEMERQYREFMAEKPELLVETEDNLKSCNIDKDNSHSFSVGDYQIVSLTDNNGKTSTYAFDSFRYAMGDTSCVYSVPNKFAADLACMPSNKRANRFLAEKDSFLTQVNQNNVDRIAGLCSSVRINEYICDSSLDNKQLGVFYNDVLTKENQSNVQSEKKFDGKKLAMWSFLVDSDVFKNKKEIVTDVKSVQNMADYMQTIMGKDDASVIIASDKNDANNKKFLIECPENLRFTVSRGDTYTVNACFAGDYLDFSDPEHIGIVLKKDVSDYNCETVSVKAVGKEGKLSTTPRYKDVVDAVGALYTPDGDSFLTKADNILENSKEGSLQQSFD